MPKTLNDIVAALETLAPRALAEPWDNVGLLVAPARARRVGRVWLTIDLTDAVMDEAASAKAGLIVAYHPPIFSPLTRLTAGDPKQRLVLRAIETRMAIYSPHTALDAAEGGVGDWLCEGLGAGEAVPIHQADEPPAGEACKVVVFVPRREVDRLRQAMAAAGAGRIGDYSHCSYQLQGHGTFLGGASTNPTVGRRGVLETAEEVRLEMPCSTRALPAVARAIRQVHCYEEPAWEVYPLQRRPSLGAGPGRVLTLRQAVTVDTLVRRVKTLCGLKQVRRAQPAGGARKIRTIGVCPGAGGSLFKGLTCDAYLTGEMRHHDVLAKAQAGSAVILTDHTHTERGYLPTLRRRMLVELGAGVNITISRRDADPLEIV